MSLPKRLSASVKHSFAYHTIKDRLPVIITKALDATVRHNHTLPHEFKADGRGVVEKLNALKYELQTNKPLRQLQDSAMDANLWHKSIDEDARDYGVETAAWFVTSWLYAECYFYRRIREAFILSEHLKDFDPFRSQKDESFSSALNNISILSDVCLQLTQKSLDQPENAREVFQHIVQFSLWGNKTDLSLLVHSVDHSALQAKDVDKLGALSEYLVANDLPPLTDYVCSLSGVTVDLVLDNAGYELFTDLCLAHWLVTTGIATRVRLHTKQYGWFVSDATERDVQWTVAQCAAAEGPLGTLGAAFQRHLDSGAWILTSPLFWVLPHDYAAMQHVAPDLYALLATSALVIFKGDLNYRKLVGDRGWPVDTALTTALGGFAPAPLVALRTNKADTIAGVEPAVAATAQAKHKDWLTSGQYGVIQFVRP
eukprot:Colp12_sorted_trinity150504_noHs@36556